MQYMESQPGIPAQAVSHQLIDLPCAQQPFLPNDFVRWSQNCCFPNPKIKELVALNKTWLCSTLLMWLQPLFTVFADFVVGSSCFGMVESCTSKMAFPTGWKSVVVCTTLNVCTSKSLLAPRLSENEGFVYFSVILSTVSHLVIFI